MRLVEGMFEAEGLVETCLEGFSCVTPTQGHLLVFFCGLGASSSCVMCVLGFLEHLRLPPHGKMKHRRGSRASCLTSGPPDDGLGVLEASSPIWVLSRTPVRSSAATCSTAFQAKLFSMIISL